MKPRSCLNSANLLTHSEAQRCYPEKEQTIRNLTARLRECSDSVAAKYIIEEIELLDAEISVLRQEDELIRKSIPLLGYHIEI